MNNFVKDARILVVDDNEANLNLIADIFEDADFTNVFLESDSMKVLEQCTHNKTDLILLDIRMPHLTGTQILALLVEQFAENIPLVVIMTAENDPLLKHEALCNGAIDYLLKPLDPVELVQRVTNLLSMQSERQTQIDKNAELLGLLVQSMDEMSELAIQDPISQLPNRHALSEEIKRYTLSGIPITTILLSIDDIDDIENMHGHVIAENLFREIIHCCADSPTLAEPYIGCWSGYQLMLLTTTASDDAVFAYINRLQETLNTPFTTDEMYLRVRYRMGIRLASQELIQAQELLRQTLIALPNKKQLDNVRVFNNTLQQAFTRKYQIKSALPDAIAQHEFSLVYQPKVALDNHTIVGAEALIRWTNEALGFISPAEFISIAESTGDIVALGEWIVEQALRDLSLILNHPKTAKNFKLAVNLSIEQFLEVGFTKWLIDAVEASNISSHHLQIEVTESVMIHDTQFIFQQLETLRSHNITVALDDFGTGYSSLNYIRSLPIDVLKIDRSFIDEINASARCQKLVSTIIDLAKNFKFKVVAEGIEERTQADILRHMGCDEAQGFYFHRPLPLAELQATL